MSRLYLPVFVLSIALSISVAAYAGPIGFSTYGNADVSYSDASGDGFAGDEYGEENPDNVALANFADPTLISGFSYAKTSGLNSVGAMVGASVNSVSNASGPEPWGGSAKESTSANLSAVAESTNRYYYGGQGTNMVATISMDFLYDGFIQAAMGGLVAPADPGALGETWLTYRVYASAGSEGLWDPSGSESWYWNFSEEATFFLTYNDVTGEFAWKNEGGQILGASGINISGKKDMDIGFWDYAMLQGQDTSFLVTYGIEVTIAFNGLGFEDNGYMYLKSDFYDTLSVVMDSVNIDETPFAAAVPAPSAVVLLASGLLGLVARRRI